MIPHTKDGSNGSYSLEKLPCSAIQPKIGMGMVFSSGKLAKVGATAKPEYICMTEADAAVAAGTEIQVLRVLPDMVFEAITSANASSNALGSFVTIADDGIRVTATPTNGKAELVGKDDGSTGTKVYVRFP